MWFDGALYFSTGSEEQKFINLSSNPQVALLTGSNGWQSGLDVVIEGRAVRVTDDATLQRVAEVWREKWDGRWQWDVHDGSFHHPGGGEALVFAVSPAKGYAFAKGAFGQTSFRF